MRSTKEWHSPLRRRCNAWLLTRPGLLNRLGASLTVVDVYGAPGDTIITATICRKLHRRFPRLRLNCITSNPELLLHDPNIQTLNQPEDFLSVWSWYYEIGASKDGQSNLLSKTLKRMGLEVEAGDYRARLFLTDEERHRGKQLLGACGRPVLTFHTRSRSPEKNWPLERWRVALQELERHFHLVHLGDDTEPELPQVQRFAGKLGLRESLTLMAQSQVHVGSVSFLMHAANGLNVPSVIIYGGRETPANSGYEENINLFAQMPCGPCWLPYKPGDRCPHAVACMEQISPADVVAAVYRQARLLQAT